MDVREMLHRHTSISAADTRRRKPNLEKRKRVYFPFLHPFGLKVRKKFSLRVPEGGDLHQRHRDRHYAALEAPEC